MAKTTIKVDLYEFMKDRFDKVDKHLEILNGQTAKNTTFKNRIYGGLIVITTIVSMFGGYKILF